MKILIAADSWGCGEWSYISEQGSFILHKGLEQYLSDSNHTVFNISNGGAANCAIIKRMERIKKKFDYVFFIQTDPLRDLRPYQKFSEFKTFNAVLNKQKDLIDETYNRLNNLGYSIHCIGGCSKLDLDLIKKYKNLIPLIESVTEFLIPDYSHPAVWFSDWLKLINDQFDLDELEIFLKNKKIMDSLMDKHSDLFFPDGYHPNRKAHKILFNEIIKVIDNKI